MSHGTSPEYSEELRRRAVDEVLERGRTIPKVAEQLGIGSAETLRSGSASPNATGPLAVRCAFVDEHRARWPVAVMCRTIGLSERSYHAARVRPPSARALSDEWLKSQMVTLWKENYSCYGAERIWRALNRNGISVARCTVEQLMPKAGIRGV